MQRFSRCFTSENGFAAATQNFPNWVCSMGQEDTGALNQSGVESCRLLELIEGSYPSLESGGAPCCCGRCPACIQGKLRKMVLSMSKLHCNSNQSSVTDNILHDLLHMPTVTS